jgi:hypothetical protein
MSLTESLKQEHRAAVAGLKFSEALDEYLEERGRGPDESGGYTDKAHYYRLEALRERMDELAPVPSTPTPVAQASAPSVPTRRAKP